VRLWSLHPKYLDPWGLVAVWREALLAREVLRGRTHGISLASSGLVALPVIAVSSLIARLGASVRARCFGSFRGPFKNGSAVQGRALPNTPPRLTAAAFSSSGGRWAARSRAAVWLA
jgi:hypothetical protein